VPAEKTTSLEPTPPAAASVTVPALIRTSPAKPAPELMTTPAARSSTVPVPVSLPLIVVPPE